MTQVRTGALVHADLKGFTAVAEKLCSLGKKGTEQLTDLLNASFAAILQPIEGCGGTVLYFAGDSVTAWLPREEEAGPCVAGIRALLAERGRMETVAGDILPEALVVSGAGSWNETTLSHGTCSHVYLSGPLVSALTEAAAEGREAPGITVRGDRIRKPIDHRLHPGETAAEHRPVASLFVRISGQGNLPPDERLFAAYRTLAQIAATHGGTLHCVDSMVADGCRVFLLFGAPATTGRDSMNAVHAGLEATGALNGIPGLRARAGAGSGFAYAGVVGNRWRRSYTVIGDTVNTAARLCDTGPPGGFTVCGEVRRETREHFRYRRLPPVEARGKTGVLSRYAPSSGAGGIRRAAGFVGRARELETLGNLARRRGAGMELVGEAGVGKSRLLDELQRLLEKEGVRLVRGRPEEPRRADDYLGALVGMVCGTGPEDPPDRKRKKLHQALLTSGGEDLAALESFPGGMLFGLPYPGGAYDSLPPRLRRMNLLECVTALLISLPPCSLIVFEDVHLLTGEEMGELSGLLARVRSSGGPGVLVCRRPEGHPPAWGGEEAPEVMELQGLSSDEGFRLVPSVLGGGRLDPSLGRKLVDRTGGNPFFLLQTALYLAEKGLMVRRGNRWEPSHTFREEALPGNVASMILARVDRLSPGAKECLRAASVFGQEFALDLLDQVLEKPSKDWIREWVVARLAHPLSLEARDYVFSQVMIRDVVYDSMMRREREAIHRRAANLLERRSDTPAALLAHHFTRGEDLPRAVRYHLLAGRTAREEYRNRQALEHFRRAADMAPEVPGSFPDLAAAWEGIARVHDSLGEYDAAMEAWDRLLKRTRSLKLRTMALEAKAEILYTRGDIQEALALMARVEEEVNRSRKPHPRTVSRVASFRAWSYCVLGRPDEAMKQALQAVVQGEAAAKAMGSEGREVLGFALNTLASVHWVKGEMESAGEIYLKALAIAEALGKVREAAITLGNIGLVHQNQGRYGSAVEFVEKNLKTATRIGDKFMVSNSHGQLAPSLLRMGEIAGATHHCSVYRRMSEEMGSTHDLLLSLATEASIALETREASRLHRAAGRLLQVAEEKRFLREKWKAFAYRGREALAAGDLPRAGEELEKALALLEELDGPSGMGPLLAALARQRALVGRKSEALSCLSRARERVKGGGPVMAGNDVMLEDGRVMAVLGEFHHSLASLEEALGAYEACGALLDVAATEHDLGALHLRWGKVSRAMEFLDTARKRFLGMGLGARADESAFLMTRD